MPFYHLVVADQRMPRDGRFIERVGYYDAVAKGKATKIKLNEERIEYWIGKGAQPTHRVAHVIQQYKQFVATGAYAAKKPRKKAAPKAQESTET